MIIIKLILVWIQSTFLNKTAVSSATGSGAVILTMVITLQGDIKKVDKKVGETKVEVMRYVDDRHAEVIHTTQITGKDLDYIVKSLNAINGKIDLLDERVYEINKTKRGK